MLHEQGKTVDLAASDYGATSTATSPRHSVPVSSTRCWRARLIFRVRTASTIIGMERRYQGRANEHLRRGGNTPVDPGSARLSTNSQISTSSGRRWSTGQPNADERGGLAMGGHAPVDIRDYPYPELGYPSKPSSLSASSSSCTRSGVYPRRLTSSQHPRHPSRGALRSETGLTP